MRRLAFTLADFSRVQWSPKGQPVWEERFRRAGKIWNLIERQSVVHKMRPSCLLTLDPQEMIECAHWATKHDLVAIPVAMVAHSNSYSNASMPAVPGQAFSYRVIVCNRSVVGFWDDAWVRQDDKQIGALLGFPSCCVDFFLQHWVRDTHRDLTWAQAVNTQANMTMSDDHDFTIDIVGHPVNNVLMRQLGVRIVPHLPCSYKCIETGTLGLHMLEFALSLGYDEEVAWIKEILDWPMEWTALHGIAETVTPVCKVMSTTDATDRKYTVRFMGRSFPEEGERNFKFPFIKPPTVLPIVRPIDRHTMNGFKSRQAMEESHKPILDCIAQVDNLHRVQDLGCGNGQLLRKINGAREIEMFGVEHDATRVDETGGLNVLTANIFDMCALTARFDVNILAIDRLFEIPEEDKSFFVRRLRDSSPYVIVYSYSDKFGHESLNLEGWKEQFFSSNSYCLASLLASS
jgi:hypothetical protein